MKDSIRDFFVKVWEGRYVERISNAGLWIALIFEAVAMVSIYFVLNTVGIPDATSAMLAFAFGWIPAAFIVFVLFLRR